MDMFYEIHIQRMRIFLGFVTSLTEIKHPCMLYNGRCHCGPENLFKLTVLLSAH